MCIDQNQFEEIFWQRPESGPPQWPDGVIPQPGEIWQVREECYPAAPELVGDRLKSPPSVPSAAHGHIADLPRYVMVVRGISSLPFADPEYPLTVMVCSAETTYHSDVDVLLPAPAADRRPDLLAETWHICPMFLHNLQRPTGERLSRRSYDLLLTIGDRHCGLESPPPALEISSEPDSSTRPEIIPGPPARHRQPPIVEFHRRELAWSQAFTRQQRADPWPLLQAHRLIEVAAAVEQHFLTKPPDAGLPNNELFNPPRQPREGS